MPSADTLIAFLGVSILLGLTPGPDNIFVLLQSAQRGWRAGMAVVVALCSGLALAAPAPWYYWRSKVDGHRVCAQVSPGLGWERDGGP